MQWCLWTICSLFAQLVLLSVLVLVSPPAHLQKMDGLFAGSCLFLLYFPPTTLLNVANLELSNSDSSST